MKLALTILALGATCAFAAAPPQADHDAILQLAGEFKVTFHFHETLTFEHGRTPSADEDSSAHELVSVVEERPGFISLQHLLVVGEGDEVGVVKHWREDWVYEPAFVTQYRGNGVWEHVELKRRDAKGAWSQTVFSVDDSPRYGALGIWRHEGGLSFWESKETWRPLPRRERDQRKFYDVLVGLNRHTITPTGTAHEQDNYKLRLDPAGNRILAREIGTNTYERTTDFDFTPAREYWEATSGFWDAVRKEWTATLGKRGTVTLRNDGQSLGREILGLADELLEGKVADTEEAVKRFQEELRNALSGKGPDDKPEQVEEK